LHQSLLHRPEHFGKIVVPAFHPNQSPFQIIVRSADQESRKYFTNSVPGIADVITPNLEHGLQAIGNRVTHARNWCSACGAFSRNGAALPKLLNALPSYSEIRGNADRNFFRKVRRLAM
jgi:hypothetical protein